MSLLMNRSVNIHLINFLKPILHHTFKPSSSFFDEKFKRVGLFNTLKKIPIHLSRNSGIADTNL